MIEKSDLKRYSKTREECKQFVSPHAQSLVKECHDILDGIADSTVDEIDDTSTNELETILCILRNVFAFDTVLEPLAWEDKGLVGALQRIVDVYFDISVIAVSTTKLRRAVSRVIANATTSSREWCRSLYQSLFPTRYLYLACTDSSDIGDALALSLYNICMADGGNDGIIDSFVGSNGCLVLSMLLQTEAHYGENDSLSFLLSHLCFQTNRLEILFTSLTESSEMMTHHPVRWLNSNHAYLVAKLGSDASLPHCQQESSGDALVFIHNLIVKIVSEESQYNECTNDVLRNCIHLWRDVLSQQEESSCSSQIFLQHNMVTDYVSMLKALQTDDSSRFVHKQPYKGYKGDILSVLANASFRAGAIQQCLLDQGALYPILGCARGDPDAPLSREWALWTIRNLCECSAEARASIESLERQSPGSADGGEYQVTRGPKGFTIKMK